MSSKNKKMIFNSDDFGHSTPFNLGVYKGIKAGVLATSCVLANLEGYGEALEMAKDLKGIKFGVHLNLIEGKSITGPSLLTDGTGAFNKGYVEILKKSYDRNFLKDVELEFRAQIERILNNFEINHINSHVHTHSIPNLFKLVCKLAEEYKIDYIRTQFEKPYFSKPIPPVNLIKLGLLNFLTVKNKKFIPEGKKTNDYLIGVEYTGHMDKSTVIEGLKKIDKGVVEILIHPAFYEGEILRKNNYKEFLITQEDRLVDEIKGLGFELCDCSLEPVRSLKATDK